MRRFGWIVVLLMMLVLSGGATAQGVSWTIIYYMPGDTDLEQYMIGDVMEMQIVGSTDEVNIVMQMDRVGGYDDTNGTWDDTRRFYISQGDSASLSYGDFQVDMDGFIASLESKDPAQFGLTEEQFRAELDGLRQLPPDQFELIVRSQGAPIAGGGEPQGLQQEALETLGETDSSPEVLADFIIWAVENYPADRYMIMMSDHGGGWQGIAYDESNGGDPFTMVELSEALRMATEATGIEKFDVIGFDACLMGQLEVYNAIAPYVQYTFAAQEPIPGAGWEYVTPLTLLTQDPSLDVEEFGQIAIDSFVAYYTNDVQGYNKFDLHLIDLGNVNLVNEALDQFVTVFAENPDAHIEAIGYALQQSYVAADGDPNYSSVDLQDFMTKLQQYSDDSAIQAAAQGVIDAVETVQVYGAGSPLVNANGVAIYFPANADDYAMNDNNARYPEQAGEVMSSWLAFLDMFHGTATTLYAPEITGLDIQITQVTPTDYSASVYDPPVVIFDTNGEGIVDMQFYAALVVDEGISVIIDASALTMSAVTEDGEAVPPYPEGPSTSEFQWNVEAPIAVDATGNEALLTFISNPDDPDRVSVAGIYRPISGQESDAYAYFNLETRELTSVFGIEESEVGQAIGEIRLQRGDTFEPYFLVLTDDGEIIYEPSGTQLLITDEPLTFQFTPAPDGEYELTMWLEDIAGNTIFDTVNFAIANEGLDTSWRGFKDIVSGISFLYPWGWADSFPILAEDGSYTMQMNSDEGTELITVYTFDEAAGVASLDDMLVAAQVTIENFGATAEEAIVVEAGYEGEYEAAVVPYSYTNSEGADRIGWLIVTYSEDNAIGYQIDIDVAADDAALGEELANYVIGSLYIDIPIIYGQ